MYLPHTAKRLMNLGLGYPGSRQAAPCSMCIGHGEWGMESLPRRIPGDWDYSKLLETSFFSSDPLILFILVRRQVPSAPQQRKPWRG